MSAPVLPCTCPDPYCRQHARCRCGSDLIIDDDQSPAFCPACLMDVMPVGACKTFDNPIPRRPE